MTRLHSTNAAFGLNQLINWGMELLPGDFLVHHAIALGLHTRYNYIDLATYQKKKTALILLLHSFLRMSKGFIFSHAMLILKKSNYFKF